jgi:hypothetical protein
MFVDEIHSMNRVNVPRSLIVVGAGPHTAVFYFVLSWITFVYCFERILIDVIVGIQTSRRRNLIVHGIFVGLYVTAMTFNIMGHEKQTHTVDMCMLICRR